MNDNLAGGRKQKSSHAVKKEDVTAEINSRGLRLKKKKIIKGLKIHLDTER